VVVYRDRVETRYVTITDRSERIASVASERGTAPIAAVATPTVNTAHDRAGLDGRTMDATSILGPQSSSSIGISPEARQTLESLMAATKPPLALAAVSPSSESATDPEAAASPIPSDPNDLVESSSKESPDMRKPDADDPSDASAAPAISLMSDGFEIGYSERIGRVAPAPTADNVEPDFDARAVDLTFRMLDGRVGIGGRFMYGSFAQVTLDEQVWSGLGVSDTVFAATLAPVTEFYTEGFLNYRQPLFSERLALDVGATFGLSSSRFKIGVDLTAIYLITDWLGAQAGVGYGNYWYTTQKLRQDALDTHENAGITDDLTDFYRGSMIEGRYGLFIRL
jgi:hypothetical protein